MSDVKRPFGIDWPPLMGMVHCDQHREVCEYALALEAALAELWRENMCKCSAPRCVELRNLIEPLYAQIPAPQKESR